MIKIVEIGSEERIEEYNRLMGFVGRPQINFMQYGDLTMAVYMFAPYIEWEIMDWESRGYEFVQLIDSRRMIVKKTN